jgi:arginase family enzyme
MKPRILAQGKAKAGKCITQRAAEERGLVCVHGRTVGEAVSERHRKATEIHLDADLLDDAAMPAVDYRLPGGLSAAELSVILRTQVDSGKAVGLEITVFNRFFRR